MLLLFFSVQTNERIFYKHKNAHKKQLGKVLQVKKSTSGNIYQIYSYLKVWCLAKMLNA